MKNSNRILPLALACVSTVALLQNQSSAADRSITEFEPKEAKKLKWQVVDDSVMGGRSQGKISISDAGVLRFNGKLSLENNGGFSSLRTGTLKLDLSDSQGFVTRVKGDGRTYQMRVGSDARYRGMEVSFMAEIPTKKDEWTEVRIPFSQLKGSWRGRTLEDEVFNPAKTQRLGLLLGDKKAGPFELQVDWIRTYASGGNSIVDIAVADGRFKTLAAALTEAGLVDVLKGDGPFTVFAPTDEAFAKLPKGTVESLLKPENRGKLQSLLKYHVSPGATKLVGALDAGTASTVQGDPVSIAFAEGQVRVNDAAILAADIEASNGVIHVIDSVLLPPSKPAATDILGVAKSAGTFNTLLAAVEAAGLTSAIAADGPFTVLAPTDEAFAALPEGTVEMLLKKENLPQLKSILTYHVIVGRISAGDALNAKSAKTLGGQSLQFGINGGRFQVGGATIRTADIACDNGVIHVIDAVLIPSNKSEKQGKAAAVGPAALIEDAIDRGVPAFNRGDHGECAQIYKTCLETLSTDERLKNSVRKTLKKVLASADKVDSPRDRAWLYRGGLDHAYEAAVEL